MVPDWLDDDRVRWLLLPGLLALGLAAFAWWRDYRRRHRTNPDAVGVIDWTTLFFWTLLIGCVLLVAALKSWLRP
ncbi:hypothetical protein C0V78_00795 [Novosphingobium sp. TH158]|nr:hypothetical protein C0V78_00795 [Novosphingobium sp. TH158]